MLPSQPSLYTSSKMKSKIAPSGNSFYLFLFLDIFLHFHSSSFFRAEDAVYRGEKGGWEMYEVEHSFGIDQEEEEEKDDDQKENEEEKEVVDALDLTKPDHENKARGFNYFTFVIFFFKFFFSCQK